MLVRTDDEPNRLRNVWLGPNGFEWPVAARYSAWGVASALFLVLAASAKAFLPALWFLLVGLPTALVTAVLVTRAVMRHVTHDKPVSSQIRLLLAELHAPRPTRQAVEYVVSIPPHLLSRK